MKTEREFNIEVIVDVDQPPYSVEPDTDFIQILRFDNLSLKVTTPSTEINASFVASEAFLVFLELLEWIDPVAMRSKVLKFQETGSSMRTDMLMHISLFDFKRQEVVDLHLNFTELKQLFTTFLEVYSATIKSVIVNFQDIRSITNTIDEFERMLALKFGTPDEE